MTTAIRGLTVEEIMAGTGLSRGSVYRLASVGKWRRLRLKGQPTGYHPDDVFGKKTA